ncbi:aromatic amino acid transaminase [Solirhodobacter olei]|uniref:amino acid aminotransferase n=1 Tax=Solirhodobacter olei TaxID=2493082 RepID=UPI000FDBD857|nr:amino acid aminotransferase [Solirhodobacter olei]
MFEALKPQPADKILALMQMYRDDPRAEKIDLGVGVYKDASGNTPIMRAVKTAEQQLWAAETTKSYTALVGDAGFHAAMAGLILGPDYDTARFSAAATPGGTGAVRQALDLVRMATPGATVWLPDPTWPNHNSIVAYLGMKTASYRYFDAESRAVDFGGLVEDLGKVAAGDLVLLHGCCHNPTGANLNLSQWAEVAEILAKRGAVPLIDIAYQGFGDGLEDDAAGTRLIVERLPEVLIAASCSKNFGLYRERVGILMAMSTPAARQVTQGSLAYLNRQNYSFPPDHGARLVTMILGDDTLRAEWKKELEEMRLAMLGLREQLASELRRLTGSDRFGFIAQHRGMFSRLGATPEQVERLRTEHGIYMVGDSRLNIAGLNAKTVPVLAAAIAEAGI